MTFREVAVLARVKLVGCHYTERLFIAFIFLILVETVLIQ
jgi:hypothetical protein